MPPQRIPRGIRCPTVIVLAWEFDRIPDETWDADSRNNWVEVIRDTGNAVTISDFATRVIRKQVGSGTRLETVPAPIPTRLRELWSAPARRWKKRGKVSLELDADIIDTRGLRIDAQGVVPLSGDNDDIYSNKKTWDGQSTEMDFRLDSRNGSRYLLGFYAGEPWGTWSRTATPSVILPWLVTGRVEVEITLVAFGSNVGREIAVLMGNAKKTLRLPGESETHTLQFELDQAGANRIQFMGITPEPASKVRDPRTLALGLTRIVLRRPEGESGKVVELSEAPLLVPAASSLEFEGMVYTSVFNPADGRKNWGDMVSAFCWAFREDASKTLVLKMSHQNPSTFLGQLMLLLCALHPFKCRIVAIHGYLPGKQMDALIEATDFFVNTSEAEGQCLPLLEFMARGVPAIAPRHTAMQSYINSANSYVLSSSLQPYFWPNDPRRAYRTCSYRLSWDSLHQAFLASAETSRLRYAFMSLASIGVVRRRYSPALIRRRLRRVLKQAARGTGK